MLITLDLKDLFTNDSKLFELFIMSNPVFIDQGGDDIILDDDEYEDDEEEDPESNFIEEDEEEEEIVVDEDEEDNCDDEDDDYCSDESSTTSTSSTNNQPDNTRVCDCCYCEVFGHGVPPVAPTSRNYNEMRERLRLRLSKRRAERCERSMQQNGNGSKDDSSNDRGGGGGGGGTNGNGSNNSKHGDKSIDELLNFINGTSRKDQDKPANKRKDKNKSNNNNNSNTNNKKSNKNNSSSKSNLGLNQQTTQNVNKKANITNQNFSNKPSTLSCHQNITSQVTKELDDSHSSPPDDVFMPRDIDLNDDELDEFERELEAFKRFCFDSVPLVKKERVRVQLKDSNFFQKFNKQISNGNTINRQQHASTSRPLQPQIYRRKVSRV